VRPTGGELDEVGCVACASVRSGFELLLEALALEPDSEVLVSAVTHPDMPRILERHNLVPVPVDIDPATLAPSTAELEAAITKRTRAVLVAHLFGGRVDLKPIAAVARANGLLLVEDCAQSLRHAGDQGDGVADVSMFSFGSIKTCAALGGGLLYVRDRGLRELMRELHARWPRQSRREYAARVLRFVPLCALQQPIAYGAFVRAGAVAGVDTDRLVNGAVHALRPPSADHAGEFDGWLRRRPSAPLLALLRHRLRSFDEDRLARRAARGEQLARGLPSRLPHPGTAAVDRTHWVFPVLPENPDAFIRELRRAGFDATKATTSIVAVGSPPPPRAAELMERVVFVPAYPELPPPAFDRLRHVVEAAA